ncbi:MULTISPECIES: hypothetical protein [Sphingomonas]|uniref:hypothetical protein n=1 Tax=Sphingomonas TaxID=13687 RepID=UPI000DEF7BAB|nr:MULTISPECIES: hypothetical protein [Sphingomonas]
MPKVSWNAFINAGHPDASLLGNMLSPRTPTPFDKNMRELPSPFAALCKELGTIIKGDWAAKKGGLKSPCVFLVADPADVALVHAAIGLRSRQSVTGKPWRTAYTLDFSDREVGPLLRKQGYNV